MFHLTLGPTDHRALMQLSRSERDRLRAALARTRVRPWLQFAGSLTLGRLRLAASCTVESGRSPAAHVRPVT